MEAVSLAASIVSIVVTIALGGLAIWLSVHFYTQTTSTESHVEVALAAIKSQTETLKDLTGTLLNRLTKYVTTPRPEIERSLRELTAMRSRLEQLPQDIARISAPSDGTLTPDQVNRINLELYIMMWRYAGQTNVLAGQQLLQLGPFDPSDPVHIQLHHMIDISANDFDIIARLIANFDEDTLRQSPRISLYQDTLTNWAPAVGTTIEQLTQTREHDDTEQSGEPVRPSTGGSG